MSRDDPSIPLDYEELDFAIKQENWNEYELTDGTRIRGRIFLSRVIRYPENRDLLYSNTMVHWTIHTPSGLRHEPTMIENPQELKSEKYRMSVVDSNEYWNFYEVRNTGQELKVKLILDEVFRFKDTYDELGCPFYDITHIPQIVQRDNPGEIGSA